MVIGVTVKKFFSSKIGFLILILIVLVIILLVNLKITSPIRGVFLRFLQPFQYATLQTTKKVINFFQAIKGARTLQLENQNLENQIAELKSEIASLSEVALENEILRDQLSFSQRKNFKLVPAEITNYEPSNFLQSLTISQGAQAGIKKGMAVISAGNLVGKISEVFPKSAKVILISDPTSRINALVQNSRAPGLVKGQVGGGLLMDLIPQNETIKVGELVITSALGEEFPRGILIGEISEIRGQANLLFQQAVIRSPLNFKKLEVVFVIVGYQ